MFIGTSVQNDLIRAEVRVGGVAQSLYRSAALDRVFVVGQPGQVYTLGVQVLTPGRVEVLNSVDGRNTLKDEPAYLNRTTGLVISGHGEFTGWRISDEETRQFMFGTPERSIAAQATGGDTSNVGVIGFAAYAENSFGGYRAGFELRGGSYGGAGKGLGEPPVAMRGGGGLESMRGGSIGTGAGRTISDRVGTTHFERSGAPQLLVIGYDTEEVLRQLGVLRPGLPQAFPQPVTGYAKYTSM